MESGIQNLPLGTKFSCTLEDCRDLLTVEASRDYDGSLNVLFAIPYGSTDSLMDLYTIDYYPLFDKETGMYILFLHPNMHIC